jgi:hypothetical protein
MNLGNMVSTTSIVELIPIRPILQYVAPPNPPATSMLKCSIMYLHTFGPSTPFGTLIVVNVGTLAFGSATNSSKDSPLSSLVSVSNFQKYSAVS